MLTEARVKQILDTSVKDISRRVGKVEVVTASEEHISDFKSPYTISVITDGDFQDDFSFCADRTVLETIARNMMHGADINEELLHICSKEFFNILCGHAISAINRLYHTSLRFSIPCVRKGLCSRHDENCVRNRRHYSYTCGTAKFEISDTEEIEE